MFRKLILALAALFAPLAAFGQCPVVTNGATAQYVNDSTTGTAVNTVTALTTAGNAIKYPHAQGSGAVGVAYYGAGTVPNSAVCVQVTGTVPIIADGAVTAQHWVIVSTTTDGYIHDTGSACTSAYSGAELIGCSTSAASGSGVAALVSLRIAYGTSGISGTASTNCGIKGTGTNTVGCGASTDTGTYFQPGEVLDLQVNNLVEESTTAAGTYTAGKLACITGSATVGDCASAAANSRAIGVNLAKNGSLPVTVKIGSSVTAISTSSVTWTAGDYVCSDASNAATMVDNGTTPCVPPQVQIGFVKATDGGNTTSHFIDVQLGTTGTQTIASGTITLGTSAIASGACATVVTVSATGVLTTDTISTVFNADPTATTGYAPSANGGLFVYTYPTANNVNAKVCNDTSSSITPGAATLNFRVTR